MSTWLAGTSQAAPLPDLLDPEPSLEVAGHAPEASTVESEGALDERNRAASTAKHAKPKPRSKAAAKKERTTTKRSKRKTPKKRRARWGDAACDYRTPVWLHEVQPGEHLGRIAGTYGVRRADLLALNSDLHNPNIIQPGDKIRVCPELEPRERIRVDHTVRVGDTLTAIARAYDRTVDELMGELEGQVRNANQVRVGQRLTFWIEGDVVPEFRRPEYNGPSKLTRPIRLTGSSGWRIRRPKYAWGSASTVHALTSALRSYRRTAPNAPVLQVGDLSKREGGKIPRHVSHRDGSDVDLGFVHRGPSADKAGFLRATPANLDVGRTWKLVQSLLDTGRVRYIFIDWEVQKLLYIYAKDHGVSRSELDELFQYPRSKRRRYGIIRHWHNHRDHMHVRFR